MLGLGDVVLPGIMIAMALRFDFWRWCEARRETEQAAAGAEAASGAAASKTKEDQQNLPKYIKPTGTWGERFWNCGSKDLPGVFPKPYFWTSIIGYIVGMLATLYVMHVWNHAQPALLYLVPGVLGAVWGTAVVRKEVKLAWNYSEEVTVDDDEDEKKKKEGAEKAKTKGKNEKKGENEKAQEQQRSEPLRGTTTATISTTPEDKKNDSNKEPSGSSSESQKPTSTSEGDKKNNVEEEEEQPEDDDIELVDEKGEAEYISVKIVKKPAPGAAFARR